MNINEMKLKDISEEALRKYLEQLDRTKLILDEENLKVTHYQNGDPIPLAVSDEQWKEFGKMGIGAYSIEDNGSYLYNWYAVNDERELAPKGWRIPTDEEWDTLEEQLLKSPACDGSRSYHGHYCNIGVYGSFWSSSETNSNLGWHRALNYNNSGVNRNTTNKQTGFSVRCVKEENNERK